MCADTAEPRIRRETGVARQVASLIEPVLEDMDYRVVRIRMTGQNGATLQIMVDRADRAVTIEDCEIVSRAISPMLDVEDPLPDAYQLEVSTPGIDRPLVRPSDFERWAGHEAKVEMTGLIDGQRRFRGELEGFLDGEVRLFYDRPDTGERVLIGLPFDQIAQAKLVLTDALIAAAGQEIAGEDETPAPEVRNI